MFPWFLISQVETDINAFLEGDVHDDTTVSERVLNDFDIRPNRQLRAFTPATPADFSPVEFDGRRDRRDRARAWIGESAPALYRIVAGALDFDDALWGALLLDPRGRVVHEWKMSIEDTGLSDSPDTVMNLYGLGFFPDGSAAFTMQERSGGLVKIDVCSRVQWTKSGLYHHVAAPTEDFSAFWTFGGSQADLHPVVLLVNAKDGSILESIDMADVERANPHKLIFDLRRDSTTAHGTHPNDIEPLPTAMADAFPNFSPGDLLISYHTTNLVFVLDPETLEIKWWYVGAGDGQHDPDWQADGTISLFNNNYRSKWRGADNYSTIVEIDPRRNMHEVIVDGAAFDFYSNFNGHHLVTSEGTVLVTSSTQGRVFEVDPATNRKVFEFVNAYDFSTGHTLHMAEAFVVEEDIAREWMARDCS